MLGGGVLLTGFDKINGLVGFQRDERDAFRGGKQLGVVEFTGEGRAPLEQVVGSGLDARMYCDLSVLTSELHEKVTTSSAEAQPFYEA